MTPWDKTLHWLTITGNRTAGELLLRLLDSQHSEFRQAAASALMLRPESMGHRAILERIDPASQEWRGRLTSLPSAFCDFLRSQLVQGSPQERTKACRFILETEQFDFIPLLANLLGNGQVAPREVVAQTMLELCRRLASQVQSTGNGETPSPNRETGEPRQRLAQVAQQVSCALAIYCDHFSQHASVEIVQAFLLLSEGNSQALAKWVQDRYHAICPALLRLLEAETAPNVVKALCHFLQQEEVPPAILGIYSRRTDLAFVREFLRAIGPHPSAALRRHLRKLRQVRWLGVLPGLLPFLNENEEAVIARATVRFGVPRAEMVKVLGLLLERGRPAGRRAAAEALGEFHGAEANALALQALADADPLVQAAIIRQLRRRGILGALPIIIHKLESPHGVVRRAARKSLREFSFPHLLQIWDMLPQDAQKSTGMLVTQVDSRSTLLLQAELLSRSRVRRRRALEIAERLELVPQLESAIIPLLEDENQTIRAEAALALAQCRSAASLEALTEALHDRSATVRDIVAKVLEERRLRVEAAPQSLSTAVAWPRPTTIETTPPQGLLDSSPNPNTLQEGLTGAGL